MTTNDIFYVEKKEEIPADVMTTKEFNKYLAEISRECYGDIEQYHARYNELAKLFKEGTVCIDRNGTKHILSDSEQYDVANALLSLYQWKIDSTMRELYTRVFEGIGYDKNRAIEMSFSYVRQIKLKEHMEENSKCIIRLQKQN